MKKLLVLIIVLILVSVSTCTWAAESEAVITTIEEIEASTVTDTVADTAIVEEYNSESQEEIQQPLGEWLLDTAEENIMSIFSGLSVTVSAVLLFLYRKRLVPFITQAVTAFSEFITGIKNDVVEWKTVCENKIAEEQRATQEKIKTQEAEMLTMRKEMSEALTLVGKLTNTVTQEVNLLNKTLNAQEDTLNVIVQSSSMAQWKKDEVGAKHAAHVAAVADLQAKLEDTEDGEEA